MNSSFFSFSLPFPYMYSKSNSKQLETSTCMRDEGMGGTAWGMMNDERAQNLLA
jgi:hypothetical protein